MRISDWSSDVCSSDLLATDLQSIHAAHADIEQHQIRFFVVDDVECSFAVVGLANDLVARKFLQEALHALTRQRLVIHNHDAHRSSPYVSCSTGAASGMSMRGNTSRARNTPPSSRRSRPSSSRADRKSTRLNSSN